MISGSAGFVSPQAANAKSMQTVKIKQISFFMFPSSFFFYSVYTAFDSALYFFFRIAYNRC
jgi:hypothetical protein